MASLLLLAAVACAALGIWQIQRRTWKHDLIARVTQRLHAPAQPAPATGEAATRDDAYRRVFVTGHWPGACTVADARSGEAAPSGPAGPQPDTEYVQAVTVLGPGWWAMSPFVRDDGTRVWVNRGFVAQRPATPPACDATNATTAATVRLDGLLRLTEPAGGFLRANDPAAHRWFSRDVQALSRAAGLPPAATVANWFIDAGEPGVAPARQPGPAAEPASGTHPSAPEPASGADRSAPDPAAAAAHRPVPGLTVVRFQDHHAVYAFTWLSLSALSAVALRQVLRRGPAADAASA